MKEWRTIVNKDVRYAKVVRKEFTSVTATSGAVLVLVALQQLRPLRPRPVSPEAGTCHRNLAVAHLQCTYAPLKNALDAYHVTVPVMLTVRTIYVNTSLVPSV